MRLKFWAPPPFTVIDIDCVEGETYFGAALCGFGVGIAIVNVTFTVPARGAGEVTVAGVAIGIAAVGA